MSSKVSIQQLLRPTDTCKFIIHGKLLGAHANEERTLAIVKHEGTQEHALFAFEADSLGSLSVDMLMPIYDMFTLTLQSSMPAGCRVEVNVHGDVIVFLLPYDTKTAMFISQVNLAKDAYVSSEDERSSFEWLRGYETCRTGWDRFCKPNISTTPPLIDLQDEENLQLGFPEKWPWSYIITPNPDGMTEVAMCESLVNEFDPLYQQYDHGSSRSTPDREPTRNIRFNTPPLVNIEHPSEPHSRMLHVTDHVHFPSKLGLKNPFLTTSVRASFSESNITKLKLEVNDTHPNAEHKRHSQEDLLDKKVHRGFQVVLDDDLHVTPSPSSSPSYQFPQDLHEEPETLSSTELENPFEEHDFPRERPQGQHLDTSNSIENPFQEELVQQFSKSKFYVESDSEVEMVKVEGNKQRRSPSPLLHRPMSLEVLSDPDSSSSLDYNHRRMRSTTTLTAQSLLVQSDNHTSYTSAHRIPSSVPLGLHKVTEKSTETTVQRSQVYSRSPKLFRKKGKSKATTSPESKSSWVTRYQPGVLLLKGSMRECLIQRMLQEKESEFCEKKTIKLFCGSWNVNGQQAIQRMDKWLLCNEDIPDIFAIGFQELDLSPEALITKDSNREEMWVDLVESSLKYAGNYKRISIIRLVGILLLVYVSKDIVPYISDVDSDMVPCGIMGHLGNKGGVAVRFNIFHSSICIVNSHLAAHVEEVEKRNQDYHQIYSRLQFFKSSTLPYSIMDHNVVIWMGDLNYRINTSQEMTAEIIRAMADSYQFSILLRHDQLVQQQKKGEAFNQFQEPPIDFKPTYKYDPSTNTWDSSEKHRAPAWCDRVLYHSEDDSIKVLKYVSHPEMIISDHKPVSATCDLEVKVVIPEKERDVLEHITWKLDKQENETLPQVELNSLEFKFNNVKFMVPQRQYLQILNVGQRPVQLSFLTTPDRNTICKPWLSIKPDRAIILTEEEVNIELSVSIDSEMVSSFNNGREKLEDILVLHLEGGKDFFISISGSFLPSCFGSSLEQLIHLHTYIREVPTGKLLDITLSSSWEEFDKDTTSVRTSPPPLDIPKELYQLVTHLTNHGLEVESLFTDGGLTIEREKIRDILDTGGSELPGSVYSVAACLLTFLRSLSEPVIPRSFHQQCMEGCQNHILCRQIILKISTVHRRVFVYIITFLKKILDHSHVNQMDAKFLASVFGDILLSMSREMRLSHTKKTLVQYNKKKATFIYQFLTNDLTIEYR